MNILTQNMKAICPVAASITRLNQGNLAVAWLKDLLPEESRGRFLGMRMIFWVALPMLIGPAIGSALIREFGIPATLNGESGSIPVPVIFGVGALISLFALIAWFFLKEQEGPWVNIIKVGADQ